MRARRLLPFRLGLWLGIVGAAVWFVQRYQRSREVVAPPMPPSQPFRPVPAATPTPTVPIVRPEVVEVGDLDQPGEPEVGTVDVAPPPPEAPAKKPTPVKKAAKKKAPEAPDRESASEPGGDGDRGRSPRAVKEPAKKAAEAKPVLAAWVAPNEEGICPTTHPVKGKLSSKLFHLPGMFAYERTKPDRCYVDEDAAVADGLQKAKR